MVRNREENMVQKFAVVVVTYNRLTLLKECLECLRNQIYAPNNVIIVDNHSTDGTSEYLTSLPEITNGKWTLKTEDTNIGGSGGFHDGMRFAMKTDSEWFLLIDDDAMIAPDYLKLIAESADRHPKVLAFSGTVVTENEIVTEHRRRFNKCELPVDKKEYQAEEFEYDLSSFCGAVINRQVVEKIGYPERDFFIWYDDTEFSLRVMSLSKFINVNKAILNHKTKLASSSADNKKTKLNWKNYYGYRNIVYSDRKHHMVCYGFRYHVMRWLRVVFTDLFNPNVDKQVSGYNVKLVMNAIFDGMRGKLGINEKYRP